LVPGLELEPGPGLVPEPVLVLVLGLGSQ